MLRISSFNSAVFNVIAANNVVFLRVAPDFFVERNSWKYLEDTPFPIDSTTNNFVTQLQETLLDGKYLDPTRFENITGSECVARYTAPFITTGAGFGVPTLEWRSRHNLNVLDSVDTAQTGSGNLNVLMNARIEDYACKSS